MVRVRVYVCVCNQFNSDCWEVDFWYVGIFSMGEVQKCLNDFRDLDLDLEKEIKVQGHKISLGHISGISQRRIKTFSVLRSTPKGT